MPVVCPKGTNLISVPAHGDGLLLNAYLTDAVKGPEYTENGPIILLATATAVPCLFYLPFLFFLSKNGIPSLTFDWRGCHTNLTSKKEDSRATLTEWGTQDLPGMIEYLSNTYPNRKIVHIGHSVGGHVLPLPHNADKISHAITVGTQNAFYPLTSFRSRHQIFWNVAVPAASDIFGYFPGSKLKIVGDLPTTVMQEWRSWAKKPFYVASMNEMTQERYKNFKAPVLAISVDDDEYATRLGVQLLHSTMNCPIQFWHIDHGDLPGKFPLRHIGFFLPRNAKTLWPQILTFLREGVLPSIESLTPSVPPESDLLSRL